MARNRSPDETVTRAFATSIKCTVVYERLQQQAKCSSAVVADFPQTVSLFFLAINHVGFMEIQLEDT